MGGAVYESLFGTRLFCADDGTARRYAVLPLAWPGEPPAAMSASKMLFSGASFVYDKAPVEAGTLEQAAALLAGIDERAKGRSCFLWESHRLEFIPNDDNFCTATELSVTLTDGVVFTFPKQAEFRRDEKTGLLRFEHNAGFRFSNYHTSDNPFSNVTLCPETGLIRFAFTVLESGYFAESFRAGFVYGHSAGESLAFEAVVKYRDGLFTLDVTLDFADITASTVLLPEGISFTTRFFTVYGENVIFTAGQTAGFGLAACPLPSANAPLTLLGDYYPDTAHGTHASGILCGSLGTEYFQLPKGAPLSFSPGTYPAYAPKYPAAALSIDDFVHPSDSSPLSGACTTSWMKLPAGTLYFSQPSDNPYYEGVGSLLDPAALYTLFEEDTPYLPITPMCDPQFPEAAQFASYAATVIAPARAVELTKKNVQKRLFHASAANDNAVRTMASPSGYLLEMRGGNVDAICLTAEMRIEQPPDALVSAFNTAGMLLVAADRAALPRDFTVKLADWNFRFPVGETVLIVKSMRGKLYDAADKSCSLIGNLTAWTKRDAFSSKNPAGVSRDLLLFFEKAVADESNRVYYAPLIEAVTSEDWRGCLLLETPLTASAFPKEMRGVLPRGEAAAVSMRYFLARQAELAPGPVGPAFAGGAQYSGFAAYEAAAPKNTGAYAFDPLEIKAFFDKSALAHFGSVSCLVIPDVAGVKAEKGAVTLRGSYVERDGKTAFSLRADEGNSLTFAKDAPLTAFSVGEIALESGEDFDRFTLGGSVRFAVPQEGEAPLTGDVLSYDTLYFSRYGIMREKDTWRTDFAALTFDVAGSTVRDGSLARSLNLVPEMIVSDGKGFSALAFDPYRGRLSDLAGGLRFSASLGSAGSLSPGQFITVKLLIGWDTKGQLAFGLQMPAVLLLEGVLSLTTGAAELSYSAEHGFALRLSSVALSALGLLKLPTGGSISLGISDGSWFAAYVKKK